MKKRMYKKNGENNDIKKNFRYPHRVHVLLQEKANSLGITLSQLVRDLLEEGVNK